MTYGGTATSSSQAEERAYRKVTWRLLPFLMLCYLVAYLDRVNIGFAKLQMLSDLASAKPCTASAPGCSSSAISSSRC